MGAVLEEISPLVVLMTLKFELQVGQGVISWYIVGFRKFRVFDQVITMGTYFLGRTVINKLMKCDR